jgi:hypothetical protein
MLENPFPLVAGSKFNNGPSRLQIHENQIFGTNLIPGMILVEPFRWCQGFSGGGLGCKSLCEFHIRLLFAGHYQPALPWLSIKCE